MNENEQLYTEWKKLKEKTTPIAAEMSPDGGYSVNESFGLEDIEKYERLSNKIWEHPELLNLKELWELGEKLEKTPKEIGEVVLKNQRAQQ